MKGLTRESFCEVLDENNAYWGLVERGEQAISLAKLLQVCETYGIPIEDVVALDLISGFPHLSEEAVNILTGGNDRINGPSQSKLALLNLM